MIGPKLFWQKKSFAEEMFDDFLLIFFLEIDYFIFESL
jgi:hypothetical protein